MAARCRSELYLEYIRPSKVVLALGNRYEQLLVVSFLGEMEGSSIMEKGLIYSTLLFTPEGTLRLMKASQAWNA